MLIEFLVYLVHMTFRDIILVEEVTCQAVVLIPKGGVKYLGICLLEVVWKAVRVILKC